VPGGCYSRGAGMSDGSWITFVEVDELELNPCTVNYESSPAEPDVNWPGDMKVLSVVYNGVDVYTQMSARERDYLLDRLGDHLRDGYDDGYGDWEHDRRRDERAMA